MKIITISRKFESKDREIGKRLANQMNFAYYNKEILIELGKNITKINIKK